MKRLLLSLLLPLSLHAAEPPAPASPGGLAADALSANPELLFLQSQLASLPRPADVPPPVIPQPLDLPSRDTLHRALRDLDAPLARLALEEFRFVLAATVRLLAIDYQAASESAAVARDLAFRIAALVKMLEERPAAGVEALIERRILEGAALPFLRQAAESSLRADLLRADLNGLLGRPADSPLAVTGSFAALPDPPAPAAAPLQLRLREALISRGLAGLSPSRDIEPFPVGPWFTREGLGSYAPLDGLTRPGSSAGSSLALTRQRLLDDARDKLSRESARRLLALRAASAVLQAIPPTLIDNLRQASDLAERQYRVGALGVNLLIEAHREYLDALTARHEATLQAWRNLLDLQLLHLSSQPTQPDNKS